MRKTTLIKSMSIRHSEAGAYNGKSSKSLLLSFINANGMQLKPQTENLPAHNTAGLKYLPRCFIIDPLGNLIFMIIAFSLF